MLLSNQNLLNIDQRNVQKCSSKVICCITFTFSGLLASIVFFNKQRTERHSKRSYTSSYSYSYRYIYLRLDFVPLE